mgnify:CR=1 FL=1
MNAQTNTLNNLLRTIASGLQYPVIIILITLLILTVLTLGSLFGEMVSEHRFLKRNLPALMEDVRKETLPLDELIEASTLLKRHKTCLKELISHPDFSDHMRQALGNRLVDMEQFRLEGRTKLTDMIAKLGPIFGLLGTLIPLGPGIIALGQGDTLTLSDSLLTAFDTTVLGMLVAAMALVISAIRRSWYKNDMSILIAMVECIIETENNQHLFVMFLLRSKYDLLIFLR